MADAPRKRDNRPTKKRRKAVTTAPPATRHSHDPHHVSSRRGKSRARRTATPLTPIRRPSSKTLTASQVTARVTVQLPAPRSRTATRAGSKRLEPRTCPHASSSLPTKRGSSRRASRLPFMAPFFIGAAAHVVRIGCQYAIDGIGSAGHGNWALCCYAPMSRTVRSLIGS